MGRGSGRTDERLSGDAGTESCPDSLHSDASTKKTHSSVRQPLRRLVDALRRTLHIEDDSQDSEATTQCLAVCRMCDAAVHRALLLEHCAWCRPYQECLVARDAVRRHLLRLLGALVSMAEGSPATRTAGELCRRALAVNEERAQPPAAVALGRHPAAARLARVQYHLAVLRANCIAAGSAAEEVDNGAESAGQTVSSVTVSAAVHRLCVLVARKHALAVRFAAIHKERRRARSRASAYARDLSHDDAPSRVARAVQSVFTSQPSPCAASTSALGAFEVVKPLARGAFGVVLLVRRRATGDLFALKAIDKARLVARGLEARAIAEHRALARAAAVPGPPWAMRLYWAFEGAENLFLVLEYAPRGDLAAVLRDRRSLPEHEARFYAAEIALALQALRECGVVHRDIKPDNVLLDANGHVRLADFGLAEVLKRDCFASLTAPVYAHDANDLKANIGYAHMASEDCNPWSSTDDVRQGSEVARNGVGFRSSDDICAKRHAISHAAGAFHSSDNVHSAPGLSGRCSNSRFGSNIGGAGPVDGLLQAVDSAYATPHIATVDPFGLSVRPMSPTSEADDAFYFAEDECFSPAIEDEAELLHMDESMKATDAISKSVQSSVTVSAPQSDVNDDKEASNDAGTGRVDSERSSPATGLLSTSALSEFAGHAKDLVSDGKDWLTSTYKRMTEDVSVMSKNTREIQGSCMDIESTLLSAVNSDEDSLDLPPFMPSSVDILVRAQDSSVNQPKLSCSDQPTQILGTPDYIAPEVLRTGDASPASDMWALGICIFEMLVGIPPFNDYSPTEVFARILRHTTIDWESYGTSAQCLSPEARSVISMLLSPDPASRPSFESLRTHPFFADIDWNSLRDRSSPFVNTLPDSSSAPPASSSVIAASIIEDLRSAAPKTEPPYSLPPIALSKRIKDFLTRPDTPTSPDGSSSSAADEQSELLTDSPFSGYAFKNIAMLDELNRSFLG